jgi:hypothetical protein
VKVAVTGSTGFVGQALVSALEAEGHAVVRLLRAKPVRGSSEVYLNHERGEIDASGIEGADAVVHLAGENIAKGRWSSAKKARINDSRVGGTRFLCESLARLDRPPGTFVCASAVGYYGDRGDEVLTEESPSGSGFLAGVCRAWEAAAEPAAKRGVRVVHLRFAMILDARKGALSRMLPVFRLGLGGRIGNGNQYWSWIALDDAVGAIRHALTSAALRGPVNVAAPEPVTNRRFTETLGRVLGRPTRLPVPAPVARLALGEMADELLLASTRVAPRRLLESGYTFRYPELERALRAVLGKGSDGGKA